MATPLLNPPPPASAPDTAALRGRAALDALTAAALLLPGLVGTAAQAQQSPAVAVQFGHYREAPRRIADLPNVLPPLSADSLQLKAVLAPPNGDGLTLTYMQDTWSGATPVTTAPRVASGNRPIRTGGVGQLVTVGASPMITGALRLDRGLRPVSTDAATGQVRVAPALVHTLSSASPETRQQLDVKAVHRFDGGALSAGGGVSDERDFRSRYLNLGRRFDLNNQHSTVNLGISRTRSDMAATLDHDAAPYITKTAQQDRISHPGGQQVLRGRRNEWATSAGLVQVLGPSALLELHAAYTRSAGDLSDPYKLTSVVFAPPVPDRDGLLSGNLQALLEQRPAVRRQWNAGGKLVLHIAPLDGALHLGYGHFRDDWGIRSHRVEAEWLQPLGADLLLSARARRYTQSAARFYNPYLVSLQAYRQVSIGADGQPVITPFNPALLPAHFSSDDRLAAFGTLGFGVGVSKKLGRDLSVELGIDRAWRRGRADASSADSRYADFHYTVANAALTLSFDDTPAASPSVGAEAEAVADTHRHHAAEPAVPPGVQFAHAANRAGAVLFGYRQVRVRDAGPLRHGTANVSDADLLAGGCAPSTCLTRPVSMAMRMHMLDLTVGFSERLSLMLMPQYMSMDMDSRLLEGAAPSDQAVHLGRHASGGVGDTQAHLLYKLRDEPGQHWVLGLGLSAPTGKIDLRHRRSHQQDAGAMAYDMQTGSGTWDLLPTLTYTAQDDRWSWGAQLGGTTRLSSRNKAGYALGDRWQASGWLGYHLTPQWSATLRAAHTVEGRIQGDRSAPHATTSPADLGSNHGSRLSELGLGLTLGDLGGAYRGTSLGVEWLAPVRSHVNGYQLGRSGSLSLVWMHHL